MLECAIGDDVFDKKKERLSRRQARLLRREEKSETRVAPLRPLNQTQREYLESLEETDQIFAIGGAGTGKTYIASRWAMVQLLKGKFDKIAITRPMVSKPKHRMGFLPGNGQMKMEPWLVPIMQALKEECSSNTIKSFLRDEKIEIIPFEHMRGRSIPNAIIILDEAQNCDIGDLKLFLTRAGEGSQIIVCGDTDQVDIPDSGLETIIAMVEEFNITADIIEFSSDDVVRSPRAKEWVKAFEQLKDRM